MKTINKKGKSSNNFIKFGIIIISILVCLCLGVYFFQRSRAFEPKCTYDGPGEGWFCSFPNQILEVPLTTKDKLVKKCETDKGESKIGLIQPGGGAYFSCLVPFTDYENSCRNSSECKGKCEFTTRIPDTCIEDETAYICSNDLFGTCSKKDLYECDYWKEVKDNKIFKHYSRCEF